MKACVTTGEKRKMECREVPKPSVEPGMILLKIKYACICGSDLEFLDKVYGSIAAGTVIGHEFVGEVVEVGEGVTGWVVGDRAAPGPGYGAGLPPRRLRIGEPGGYESIGHAMAEYMNASPLRLQKVPDSVTDEQAAMVEPLGAGVRSIIGAGLKPGMSGVIIGTGKIGLLAMMAAKVYGASPVIAVDLVQSRLDKALELGANAAINAGKVDAVSEVVKLTKGGADAVVICVRDGKVLNQAVDMCGTGATISVAGVIPPTEITMNRWISKRLRLATVLGGSGGPDTLALAMYLMSHKQVDPRPLISEIMPLADIQRALDTQYSGENIAVMLKP